MKGDMILIMGVTASGKGRVAFELAKQLGAEIISIDSMKVYKRMDIGTAKPPMQALTAVNYHLIDVVEPSESFSVGRFLDLADTAIADIHSRKKPIIAVGGTALYIKALLYGLFDGPSSNKEIRTHLKQTANQQGIEKLHQMLERIDPVSAERIHKNDQKRIIRALEVYKLTGRPISSFQQQWCKDGQGRQKEKINRWKIIGLRRDKQAESKRINARVKKMIDDGLVDEVRSLLSEDKPLSSQARCAIGYAEIIDYLKGRTNLEEAIELIKKNTRQLAKHQRTWFKTFEDVSRLDVRQEQTCEQVLVRIRELLVLDS
jgi:tRNA dimethylallyltransferase